MSHYSDWDGDGSWDGFAFRAGTIPTDAASYLGANVFTVGQAGRQLVVRWSNVRDGD